MKHVILSYCNNEAMDYDAYLPASAPWFDLNGRRLESQPTKKGLNYAPGQPTDEKHLA